MSNMKIKFMSQKSVQLTQHCSSSAKAAAKSDCLCKVCTQVSQPRRTSQLGHFSVAFQRVSPGARKNGFTLTETGLLSGKCSQDIVIEPPYTTFKNIFFKHTFKIQNIIYF